MTRHRTLIPLPQVIQAGRVTLRPYTLDDAQAFWEAVQEDVAHVKGDNPSPWRETGQGHQTIDDVRERIVRAQAHWLLREKLWMGIFLTESRRYIGNIGLDSIDWELRRFEIGYWVRPTEEGRGYVGEAVRLLARCAFERLGARRLEIRCDERNTRSRRVAEREGFVREGLLRNDMLRKTGPSNTLVYALIPEDYARVKEMWAGERRTVGGQARAAPKRRIITRAVHKEWRRVGAAYHRASRAGAMVDDEYRSQRGASPRPSGIRGSSARSVGPCGQVQM